MAPRKTRKSSVAAADPPPPRKPEWAPPPLPPSTGPRRSFQNLPNLIPHCRYTVDTFWNYLERHIFNEVQAGLNLDPPYQREHVWTEEQQQRFVEHVLRGGETGTTLVFVCTNWNEYPIPNYAILDGKQRLEAVRKFLRGELRIFPDAARPEGYARQDFDGTLRSMHSFKWQVVEVKDEEEAIRLYLAINTAGTPHTAEEIARVRAMLPT